MRDMIQSSLTPLRSLIPLVVLLASVTVLAHGNHPVETTSNWATRHMLEEHHIGNFDPGSFFTLHDYDASGTWTIDEVRLTYGMDDRPTNGQVPEEAKQTALRQIFSIFDPDRSGVITREAFVRLTAQEGKQLPDVGLGPGHHGDLEYEYEIHHFEKFHPEGATEEELNHPEDIQHFKLHDQLEAEQQALDKLEGLAVVEANIPPKFRRS